MKTTFNLALVAVLAAVLGASPADAQGNGKKGRDNDRDRDRYEQRDRDRDRDDDDDDDRPRFERRDDRYDRRTSQQQRRVPPGWCRGQGNPHNTRENCRYNDRYSRWERYDSRSGRYETYDRYNRNRNVGSSRGSYDQAHREFHYSHDRQCRERAAQRPLDPSWQIRVRSDCKATHDEFHRRWGTSHR